MLADADGAPAGGPELDDADMTDAHTLAERAAFDDGYGRARAAEASASRLLLLTSLERTRQANMERNRRKLLELFAAGASNKPPPAVAEGQIAPPVADPSPAGTVCGASPAAADGLSLAADTGTISNGRVMTRGGSKAAAAGASAPPPQLVLPSLPVPIPAAEIQKVR